MKHMGRAFSSEERRGAVAEMDGMKRTKSGSSSNIAGKGNESVSVEKESDLGDGIRIDLESQPVVGGEAGVRDQDDNRESRSAEIIGWGEGLAGTLANDREGGKSPFCCCCV